MRLIHRLSSEDVLGTVAGMPGLEVLYPGGFSGAVGVVVSLEVLTAVYPEPGAASAGLLASPVPLLVAGSGEIERCRELRVRRLCLRRRISRTIVLATS